MKFTTALKIPTENAITHIFLKQSTEIPGKKHTTYKSIVNFNKIFPTIVRSFHDFYSLEVALYCTVILNTHYFATPVYSYVINVMQHNRLDKRNIHEEIPHF